MTTTSGIHHITAITSNPQKNLDFYEGFLGQKLIKQTVNHDDLRSYHLYYGDKYGRPGTLMTFFYWADIPKGTSGAGEVSAIAYGIPKGAKRFWLDRAEKFAIEHVVKTNSFKEEMIELIDPDGIFVQLVLTEESSKIASWTEGPLEKEGVELQGFYGATLTVANTESMESVMTALGYTLESSGPDEKRFLASGDFAQRIDIVETSDTPRAMQGSGSVHHIAFRALDDEAELGLRAQVEMLDLEPTQVIERNYFRAVYFRTPGEILFEISTDEPGFAIDEPREELGEKLVLPPRLEPHREEIINMLVPINLPRHK